MRYYHTPLFFYIIFLLSGQLVAKPFTIMIDPAGDAKRTGRQIGDTFERSITLQCARTLKSQLELCHPGIQVTVTRMPGDVIAPQQNANFANRLDVDLYLYLGFYQEDAPKQSMAMYTFSYGNDFVQKTTNLAWYPYDKAYLLSQPTTQKWAQTMHAVLTQEQYQKQFSCTNVCALPLAPLIGVKAPAIALEVGLKTKNDWERVIQPMVESLGPIITKRAPL